MPLSKFWYAIHKSYSQLSKLAFLILLPSATTYLCKSGCSDGVPIKKKAQNQRKVEDDMRLA